MANYIFEDMTPTQASNFAAGDTLSFSNTTLTPADVLVSNSENGFNATTLTANGKTLQFPGAALADSSTVIQFAVVTFGGLDVSLELGSFLGDTLTVAGDDDGSRAYAFGDDDTVNVTGDGTADIYAGTGNDDINNAGTTGSLNIFGEAGDDTIDGSETGDHIYGFGLGAGASADGDDSINGNGGNDYIQGNAGEDTLDGGAGRDRINGGADNDTIYAGSENDTVNGNKGDDSIYGDAGNDSLRGGQDNDTINGDAGNDVLQGDLGDDDLGGGADNDLLSGGDGNDVVGGDAGDDVLGGDAGDDVITGSTGFDVSTGGAGDDSFVFAAAEATIGTFDDDGAFDAVETITDFTDGEDTIELSTFVPLVAGDVRTATDVVFLTEEAARTYAGQQTLDANDVLVLTVGTDTFLYYEDAGTGAAADSVIKLVGVDAADIGVADFT